MISTGSGAVRAVLMCGDQARTFTTRARMTARIRQALRLTAMPTALEYRHTAHYSDGRDPDSLTSHMNEMAQEGWELLNANWDRDAGMYGKHLLYWRRPLAAEPGYQPSVTQDREHSHR